MKRKILDCISTIDEFNISDYVTLEMGVEIQDFVEPNLEKDEIDDLITNYKKLFEGFPYSKALHGPFLDLKPASPDKDIRRISQKKYYDTLRIAEELKMDYVIFHTQMNPLLNEPKIMELNCMQNAQFFNELMEKTSYTGIVLIENIFEKDPKDMLKIIDKIESNKVKINLDLGHAKLSGKNMAEWIRVLREHISYIHFHSNNGLFDEHKSPSHEEIHELSGLLNQYNMDPPISLEYKKFDLKKEIKRFQFV